MEFEIAKGKAQKCKACGKRQAHFLSDYFFLPVAPPFDTVEKREATLGGSGQFMYVKVKQCKRCHFLELYQPTREEEIQYAKGRDLSRAKFP